MILSALALAVLVHPLSRGGDTNLVASSPSLLPVTIVQPEAAAVVTTIEIDAYIDGRDQLLIDARRMQWHHLDFAAAGRHWGADAPTLLHHTAGASVEWLPEWPERPPAEIRYEALSDFSPSFGFELAMADNAWMLTKLAGRGNVTVLEQPSAANGYRLIVEFDDNPYSGADFYGIKLTAFPLRCE